LDLRAFLGVLIEQCRELLQMGIAETEHWPGRIAIQQVRAVLQRAQQVRRTQAVMTFQRRAQPGSLDQLLQFTAQLWLALHAARQCVEVVKQTAPQGVHVPLMTTGDQGQVALALFQQLEQPVFDADPPMGTALAQGSRRAERLGAVGIESTKQARGVVGHGGTSLC
jgi:hypothetical protein